MLKKLKEVFNISSQPSAGKKLRKGFSLPALSLSLVAAGFSPLSLPAQEQAPPMPIQETSVIAPVTPDTPDTQSELITPQENSPFTVTLPVAPHAPLLTDSGQPITYWYHEEYDAVFQIQPAERNGQPDGTLIVRIYDIKREDKDIRQLTAEILKIYKPQPPRSNTPKRIDREKVTENDVKSFCGYELETSLAKTGENKWEGKVKIPSKGKFNIKAEMHPGYMKITGSLTGVLSFVEGNVYFYKDYSPPVNQCQAPHPPKFRNS